jgi:hypothetical protein
MSGDRLFSFWMEQGPQMARVTCRCGETLKVSSSDPDRLTCPGCGAKIRIRRGPSPLQAGREIDDGYLRFHCPCGRRLKVRAEGRPEAGKCPDCGRIVPVPDSAWSPGSPEGDQGPYVRSHPEARTDDMDAADLERLEQWASRYAGSPDADEALTGNSTAVHTPVGAHSQSSPRPAVKMEAGLRVCTRCGKPLHMSATVCRHCGEPASRR